MRALALGLVLIEATGCGGLEGVCGDLEDLCAACPNDDRENGSRQADCVYVAEMEDQELCEIGLEAYADCDGGAP